jgi:hypothetical protein
MSENRVLRRIFRPKRMKKLFNEKLNNFYSSSNTARMIKSKMMRWVGHVAIMRENINTQKF